MESSLRVLARSRSLYGAAGQLDSRCSYRRGDRMKRREVITLLGGAAAAWPMAVRAQQLGKLPTIGFLGRTTRSAVSEWTAAFVQRLVELGWIVDQTVAIRYRWAEGHA